MRATLSISFAICAVMTIAGGAQQRSQMPPMPPSTGTAQLSGTVMTDEANPRPLRRAVVTLTMASMPIGRSTTTDEAGHFVFTQLAAGNYSAPRVTKPGYVSSTYGEKRVNGLGSPITLAEGQRLAIAFKMMRGAVITGAITDQGRPSVNTNVQATAVRIVNGVRVASDNYYYAGGSAQTDDRGVYRMYGLPPGDYVVSVSRLSGATSTPVRPITDAEIQWAQLQFQSGSAGPSTTTLAAGATAPPPPAQAVASAPVYYPGTTVVAQAMPVNVAAGQERGGVDFSLQVVPTARVDGTIVGLDGRPAATATVNLVPRVDGSAGQLDSLMMLESVMMGRPTVTNGKFSLPAVKPGEYTIAVRGASQSDAPAAGSGHGGPAPAMTLWASADISVNGADVSGLVLQLAPGVDIAGRVTFEGTAEKPADLSGISVRLRSAPTPGITVSVGVPAAPLNPDGTFVLKGVTPGRYFVTSFVPGGGATPTWTMRSARVGEIDAGDVPFEVGAGREPSDISVTFTDKVGELSGRLLDGANKPTSQLSIILFPTDKAMWSQTSRRLRQPVRPANDGAFKFTGILAGEYYLAALTDFEMADVFKPEFLEQVAAMAMKITIAEGEKKVQDLKISGGLALQLRQQTTLGVEQFERSIRDAVPAHFLNDPLHLALGLAVDTADLYGVVRRDGQLGAVLGEAA